MWDKCKADENSFLRSVYDAAYRRRDPCTECGKQHPLHHHATCDGRNLCHDCYLKDSRVVTQCYPGDLGYPPMMEFYSQFIESGE